MLVLSRRLGEEIVIGDNIRIMVVALESNKVRLGLTAPAEVSIHRNEIYSRRKSVDDDSRRRTAPSNFGEGL